MLKKLIVAALSTIVIGAVGVSAYNTVITQSLQPEAVAASVSIDDAVQTQPGTGQGNGPTWSNTGEAVALAGQGQAGQSRQFQAAEQYRGQQNQTVGEGLGQQGQARGQGLGGRGRGGRWATGSGSSGANGVPSPQNGLTEWISFEGIVSDYAPPSLSLLTDDGQSLVVELGNTNYIANLGLNLENGTRVTGLGFYDSNGGFTVGQITLAATGEAFTLRDDLGRPMWAGGPSY